MAQDLAIDLGTSNIRIYKRGVGIVVQEPSVVAYRSQTREVLFSGNEALQILDRTPANVEAVYPLKNGAIADFDMAEGLFEILFQKAGVGRFSRPRVLVCLPQAVSLVERRALVGAIYRARASEVYLINKTTAAALGCDLAIGEPEGNMVLDIGGGTTESVIMCLGEIASISALKIGSINLDESIQRHLKDEYEISLGMGTAEKIKKSFGSALAPEEVGEDAGKEGEEKKGEVRGMDLTTKQPRSILLEAEEIREAMEIPLNQIIESALECIRKVPSELNRDIAKNGIHMVGGGSLLEGIGRRLAKAANVPTHIMSEPQDRVIRGAGSCLWSIKDSQHLFFS